MATGAQATDVTTGIFLPVLSSNPPTKVSYTGTAGTSAALAQGYYECSCTSAAYVLTGTAPTATTAANYMRADKPFWVYSDGTLKVSAIQSSAAGTLHFVKVL